MANETTDAVGLQMLFAVTRGIGPDTATLALMDPEDFEACYPPRLRPVAPVDFEGRALRPAPGVVFTLAEAAVRFRRTPADLAAEWERELGKLDGWRAMVTVEVDHAE
jgi:hypothetical protein